MVYKRNLDEIEWQEMGHGTRFRNERKTFTPFGESYMPKLGITLYRLEPGKRAFPFHMHMANDEAILVIEGTGTLRYGEEEIPLKANDYVHLPAHSGQAHQMINSSDAPLLYYCLSSLISPEIVHYPDSGKMLAGAWIKDADGSMRRDSTLCHPQKAEYWDGEAEE